MLAKIAEVAKARTRLDDATGVLHASAEGLRPFAGKLDEAAGRAAFAAWASGDSGRGRARARCA